MIDDILSNQFQAPPPSRWVFLRKVLLIVTALTVGGFMLWGLGQAKSATFSIVNRITGNRQDTANITAHITPLADDPEYALPSNDQHRLDILLMGIRGRDDVANGGMLTDTILLFSLDTDTGKAALTSIPRDLTVRITDTKTEKINTAYIYNGIAGTKRLFSRIIGIGIDSVVVFDFAAFKSVVDTLGGIAITLDKPFTESEQWGYAFSLPAGTDTLTGDQALYYVRSRYESSDFDRSRRQMQVIMAIKAKIQALHLTSDPIKALELITTVRRHIDTDLNIFDLGTLKDLIGQSDKLDRMKRYQLTTENVLYETVRNGIYELLPRDNTLHYIKDFFRTVLTDKPLLPTPPATASPRTPTFSASPKPRP